MLVSQLARSAGQRSMAASRQLVSSPVLRGMATLAVDNPYTGETYAEVELAETAEALEVVESSAVAQKAWAKTTLDERIGLCKRFMEAFEADRDQIAADITGQMGKPLHYAYGEMGGMYERCEAMMDLSPAALAPEDLPAKDNFVRRTVKEPVGVVLCVAPWCVRVNMKT